MRFIVSSLPTADGYPSWSLWSAVGSRIMNERLQTIVDATNTANSYLAVRRLDLREDHHDGADQV